MACNWPTGIGSKPVATVPPAMELAAMRADVVVDLALAVAGVALAEVVFFVRRVAGAMAVGACLHHVGTPAVTVAADPN